jgi:hypothetical protein
MKHIISSLLILILWLCYSLPLYCQNYLNIRYLDGSDTNVPFGSLQKITFDGPGDKINFILTDATTQAVAFNAIQNITTGDVGSGTLLPVELVTFNATANNNTVALFWRTATEVNNYGFEIERRIVSSSQSSASSWIKIGFVQGNGTSNTLHSYSFADKNFSTGTYAYRLKQIDNSGAFKYSQETEVTLGVPSVFALSQNFPNPFNPTSTIAYDIPMESFVTIKVYDVLGKEVASLVHENKKTGSYQVSFDGSHLSSGVYFCKMVSVAHSSLIKMIIMKYSRNLLRRSL